MKKGWIRLWIVGEILGHMLLSQAFCQPEKVIQKLGNPYGTIRIAENLYMDEAEISHVAYKEFLFHIRKDSTKEVWMTMQPDSAVMQQELRMGVIGIDTLRYSTYKYELFHDHEAFYTYPMTGISYLQAAEYCKWRSDFVNKGIHQRIKRKKRFQKWLGNKRISLRYRLPTVEEWEFAAMGNMDTTQYPLGYHSEQVKLLRLRETPLMFGNYTRNSDYLHKGIPFLDPTYADSPTNSFGLINMIGNAAEMTAEEGIAKGGAYFHSKSRIRISRDIRYENPEHWLGFRCICEWVVE